MTTPKSPDKPPVIHGAENFAVSESAEAIPEHERIAITKEDLRIPEIFTDGDTLISLMCNVKDIRSSEDGEVGTLYPDQARAFQESISSLLSDAYDKIPDEAKDQLDVIVVAGDTQLVTPGDDGLRSEQQRAVLTGEAAIAAIKAVMEKNGIDPATHLISDGEKPVALTHLRDVNMLHQTDKPNVKKFMDYMIGKYGAGRELWMVYEEDSEKEMREALNVEGPSEIAERMDKLVNLCGYMANLCQADDPSRRVIVIAVGHYDNISPWAKQNLMGVNPAEGFIPVEKGGGIIIQRHASGKAETVVGGKLYPVHINSAE